MVADVEGNGRNPLGIVELSLVRLTDLSIAGQQTWLLRPAESISWRARRVHGITDDDVEDCRSFAEIASIVRGELQDAILIGHNVHVEAKALQGHLPGWYPAGTIDTLALARRYLPGLGSYSLPNIVRSLPALRKKLEGRGSHRAAADALSTAHLFLTLAVDSSGRQRPLSALLATRDYVESQRELF